MKLYFSARAKARTFNQKSKTKTRLLDKKDQPNITGSRWAVDILKPQ